MKYNTTDKKLIEIFNIKNLQSVNISDFVTNKDSKTIIIPIVSIVYDGGKTLVLSAQDKYFDTYCKKVVEVYNDEINSITEDGLYDPFKLHTSIVTDEKTHKILTSGKVKDINPLYSGFNNEDAYENHLFFQKEEVLSLLPIVKYHLKEFFKRTDKTIDFKDGISGYRDNYVLEGTVNGIITNFLLTYDKINDSEYQFRLTGFDNKFTSSEINIKFSKDKIIIYMVFDKYKIESTSIYEIVDGVVKETHADYKNDVPIYFVKKDLQSCDNEHKNLTDIDYDTSFKWFKLPFSGYYGVKTEIKDLSPNEKIIEVHYMYLGINNSDFTTKEYYSRSYVKKDEKIVLDELLKSTSSMHTYDSYIIETSFLKGNFESGYYSEYLSSRNFYRVQFVESIDKINRNEMIFLNRENGIFESADLLTESACIKLSRRD